MPLKVAICLSGQPRNYSKFVGGLLDNLIRPNNADVFLHMWYSEAETEIQPRPGKGWVDERIEKGLSQRVLEDLQPIRSVIEPQYKFPTFPVDIEPTIAHGWGRRQDQDYYNFAAHSMWYGIMTSQRLRKLYSAKTGQTYDCVVRARIDSTFTSPIILKNYDMNCMNYCNLSGDPRLLHDWFNFGSEKIMDLYASIFWHIRALYDKSQIWCNEYWGKMMMDMYNVPCQPHNFPIQILQKEC